MSAQRLRDAAKVLRDAVEDLPVDRTWRCVEQGVVDVAVLDGVGRYVLPPATFSGEDEYIYAFIATMHPGVALALADWLDDTATEVASGATYSQDALRVADQILGTDS